MRKIISVLFIIMLCLASTACTKRVFGVSEDHWNTLTPAQQTEVIRAYNVREKINAERRLAAQRQAAEEAEAQRILAEAEAERMQKHVDDIYSGEAGLYGDLLRVTIKEGKKSPGSLHHKFHAQSFLIADGEIKPVKLHKENQDSRRAVTLWVGYLEGNLDFGSDPNSPRSTHFKRLAYEPEWSRGKTYSRVSLGKKAPIETRNISVLVQVVPPPGQKYRR